MPDRNANLKTVNFPYQIDMYVPYPHNITLMPRASCGKRSSKVLTCRICTQIHARIDL